MGLAVPQVAGREGLLLISRGVTFRRSNLVLGNPLACAVVTADHLEKNLSQTDLVENEDYHQLIQQVQSQVECLIEEVCARPPLLKPAQSQALRNWLEQRYSPGQRPLTVEMFFRLQALSQACSTPQGSREQVNYYLSLAAEEKKLAISLREQLQSTMKSKVLESIDFKRWDDGCLYLDLADRLGLPVKLEFRLVVAYFADKIELLRKLDQHDPDNSSPTRQMLRFAWGWSPQAPNQSPLSRFFEFEHALQRGQEELALAISQQLEAATPTPFLLLWLGWYALYRRDYRKAEQLWFQLLSKVSPALYRVWYPRMWSKLVGKVPLTGQVRWQARHGIRCLSSARESERTQVNEDPTLFDWSQLAWKARREGKASEATRVMLHLMLSYLLIPEKFALHPFSSPDLPVALPTS